MLLAMIVVAWLVVWMGVVAVLFRHEIRKSWREPVMRAPIVAIESDDWGAGPAAQAQRLRQLAGMLGAHVDRTGRHAVMTLGIVLAVPDSAQTLAGELAHYHSKELDHPEFARILDAIGEGTRTGVFVPQLHGHEHFWPPSLLAVARGDSKVRAWLLASDAPATEALPAWLQSRWVDASELPARPLPAKEAEVAARNEVVAFRRIVGRTPAVAVPPTFIWNDVVERAWADEGVEVIVTPGRRYEGRGSDGFPAHGGPAIVNGDRSRAGPIYLVRNDYFEPARGHRAELAFEALADKSRLGRPTLIETHRANFLVQDATADAAIAELDRFLSLVVERVPELLFRSPEEIARGMRLHDPSFVEIRLHVRTRCFLRRLAAISRLRKLAWLTGLMVPALLLYAALAQSRDRQPTSSSPARILP